MGAVPVSDMPSHTAEAIGERIKGILKESLLQEDITPVVTTDCAANMRKAIQDHAGFFWVKCACHCLHNSVIKGLADIGSDCAIIGKVNSFVNLISRSPKQADAFRECQRLEIAAAHQLDYAQIGSAQHDEPVVTEEVVTLWELQTNKSDPLPTKILRMVKSVDVRWSSVYAMLKRYHILRAAILRYIAQVMSGNDRDLKTKVSELEPSAYDLMHLSELLDVLEIVKTV